MSLLRVCVFFLPLFTCPPKAKELNKVLPRTRAQHSSSSRAAQVTTSSRHLNETSETTEVFRKQRETLISL